MITMQSPPRGSRWASTRRDRRYETNANIVSHSDYTKSSIGNFNVGDLLEIDHKCSQGKARFRFELSMKGKSIHDQLRLRGIQ